jgi:anthranilate phosphoribosyltransferase
MLVVNAATALVVAGRCGNWVEGAEMARSLLADGAGLALLQRLI